MPDAVALAPAPAAAAGKPQTLDELMLAMDVVDTLRHQEGLVAREFDESRREQELTDRLRDIYKSQGIAVPDHVIQEGVKALKESRFVYTPAAPGLKRTLATLWVRRGRYGKAALGLVAAIGIWWAYTSATALRPSAIESAHAEVLREARVDPARTRAEQLLADGKAALAKGDTAAARKAIADLEALRADLRQEYALNVVTRRGEASGLERIPPNNRAVRNYYLIVEAVAPDKSVLEITIRDEEQSKDVKVKKFGVRVPQDVFERVRRDKADDGIVQNVVVGQKKRGELAVQYAMPALGGMIARIEPR